MANITATEVNKLRQQTGAGMMDCKKALVESNGDFDKAIDFLRKKGQKVANNRADRDANEGIILAKTTADFKKAVIIMLCCETDFVAKNKDFIDLANNILELSLSKSPKNNDELKALLLNNRTVEENVTDLIGKTGEKMTLAHYEFVEGAKTFAYNHPGNRLASIVAFNKSDFELVDQIGKEIAMQIAAMAPIAVDKNDVDAKTIEKEIEIGKEQAKQEGKPEAMLEKIAQGKLTKFYKDFTLLNQEFVRDNKLTVGQYLKGINKDLTVNAFKRFVLGE
ncbi:MAG: translation elongation factor Ts [Bacteroidetes bacterium CG2_30_32_10]|nr:MAG: translation elongation factor Ts [Bacteroidetes bacterium CG2_30_32_10]